MKPLYNVGDILLDEIYNLLQLFEKHQDLFALPEDSPMIIDQIFYDASYLSRDRFSGLC